MLNSRQNKREKGWGQSSHTLPLDTLVVSPHCVVLVQHQSWDFCFVLFFGGGQPGHSGGGVVMECRPRAVKPQIDAGVLINARPHPPRLVEARQLY